MLIVDRREQDLLPFLRRHDLPLTVTEMEYGDAHWIGNGPNGPASCLYAVERKRIRDLINSMRDRRLSGHQLRGMWRQFDRVILVVEGVWRCGPSGEVEVLNGRWHSLMVGKSLAIYRQLASYLLSLEWRGGVTIWRTSGPQETAAMYDAAYRWSTEKEWDQHHSHDQLYAPVVVNGGRLREPTMVERMAAQLPGIDRRAELVAGYFRTPREMMAASEGDWLKIKPRTDKEKGLGIGKGIASEVIKAMTQPDYRRGLEGLKMTHRTNQQKIEAD